MSRLFLHVGMPKTGTSYIQGFVNVNQQLIREQADVDVISGRKPHELACGLISNQNLIDRVDIKALRDVDFEGLEHELERVKSNGSDCFCSSEYFILCEKKDVIQFFKKYFEEIFIIYTVRRQDKLLASGFNQDVKALNRTSNLVWSYKNEKTMRYYTNCKEWEALGCEIKVIDYDAVKKEANGLYKAIFSLFLDSEQLLEKEPRTPPSNASNFSLSENAVQLKLCMNRLGIVNEELLSSFNEFDSASNEFLLPPGYGKIIASCYHGENQALVTEYLSCNNTSNLSFQNIDLNKNICIETGKFSWDPLAKREAIYSFLLKELQKTV